MKHTKLLKALFIALVAYGYGDLMFHIGKGEMLGILSYYDTTADDAIEGLSELPVKTYALNIISWWCNAKKEYLKKKYEN